MNLTAHFTLEELTLSQTASRLGLDNTPPPDVVDNLHRTALGLEMVRALLGAPILISSGYRSPAVNRAVGGAKQSQHLTGEAADFTSPGYGSPRKVVEAVNASSIPFDQCILEYDSWCHISFTKAGGRRQALIIDHDGTRIFA